jgi:hypothetical protein
LLLDDEAKRRQGKDIFGWDFNMGEFRDRTRRGKDRPRRE